MIIIMMIVIITIIIIIIIITTIILSWSGQSRLVSVVGGPEGGFHRVAKGWGPTGPKISCFFPSPATIFLLSSLSWGSSRSFLVVF